MWGVTLDAWPPCDLVESTYLLAALRRFGFGVASPELGAGGCDGAGGSSSGDNAQSTRLTENNRLAQRPDMMPWKGTASGDASFRPARKRQAGRGVSSQVCAAPKAKGPTHKRHPRGAP